MANKIPKIDVEVLEMLVAQIKPVGRCNAKRGAKTPLRYYRTVDPHQNFNFSEDFERIAEDLTELRRIVTFHTVGTVMGTDQFMPTTAEVLAQIPGELRDHVVAFETLIPTFSTTTIAEPPHIVEDGHRYHKTTTILYGRK